MKTNLSFLSGVSDMTSSAKIDSVEISRRGSRAGYEGEPRFLCKVESPNSFVGISSINFGRDGSKLNCGAELSLL